MVDCVGCGTENVTAPGEPGVCGTGSGNWPQPGDPELNSSILTARSGFQGIAVSWSYPNVNAHAVAHTLLYRNTVNNFETAALIRTVQGDYHFDQDGLTEGERYYYWIKIVSVNGTIGDPIGPASAVLQPSIEQLIDILEGQLTESVLYQDLKTKINLITDVSSALDDEEQNRLLGDNYFTQIIEAWRDDLDAIDTLVRQEVLERISGDDALVAQVNLILAQSNNNAAAIQTEQAVRATEDSAIAIQIDTLQATVGDTSASLQTLQSVVNGPDGLAAQYMVKTDVNGHIAGFGLYNDGATSQFIVNVDTFAISTPGLDDVFPFIIGQVNGETQIALNARTLIPDAHITNAMIGGIISSDNYDFWTQGWGIAPNGNAVFHDIWARGDIEASSIKVGTADIITTLMIQGNAVTIPVGVVGTDVWLGANSTLYNCASGTINPQGGKVSAMFSATVKSGGDFSCTFYIYQGSTRVATREVVVRADSGVDVTTSMPIMIQYSSSSRSSNTTYTVKVKWGGAHGAPIITQGYLTLQGLKR